MGSDVYLHNNAFLETQNAIDQWHFINAPTETTKCMT